MTVLNLIVGYVAHFTYLAIFLLIAGSSVAIPVPEEVTLVASGYLSAVGIISLPWAILVAIAGTLVGDNITYWVGRRRGIAFVDGIAGRFGIALPKIHRFEKYFLRHDVRAVFFSRFVVGLRFFGPLLAGHYKMSWRRFQSSNLLSAIILVPVVASLGFYFSDKLYVLLRDLKIFKWSVFVAVILVIVGILVVRRKYAQKFFS